MTTEAIRSTIDSEDDLDPLGRVENWERRNRARAEVAAIQHAARVVIANGEWTTEDWKRATDTLTAIAEESTGKAATQVPMPDAGTMTLKQAARILTNPTSAPLGEWEKASATLRKFADSE